MKSIIFIVFSVISFCFSSPTIHAEIITEVSPLQYVSPKRADLMAKYIYAKHREWGTSCQFGHDIYYRHLQVWNRFYEREPVKHTFEDFINAFDRLLDSIKHEGFDPSWPIPIGSNGEICNGAHRLTSSLLYHKNIVVEDVPRRCSYDFAYFKSKSLDSKYLDAMALQYCELKPDSFVMVIFPSAVGYDNEIEEIINEHTKIVYRKKIDFTKEGGLNFVLTAYDQDQFLQGGEKNNFSSARHKARLCFPEHLTLENSARVYLLQCDHLDLIKACKGKIRALFNISNHSVHVTDTHQEAIILARALFNENSVHLLNHRKAVYFPQFENYFKQYRNWLAINNKENEWFCVDTGAVLAAYGLRECNDLDFLHYEKENIKTNINGIDDHNSYLYHHALVLDDILFDPDNYFYYKGIKFCSLSVLKQMKERRLEPKDIQDLRLIENLGIGSCSDDNKDCKGEKSNTKVN